MKIESNSFLISVCWKLVSGINKTLSSGKTSQFAVSKTIGEIEFGCNCFVRRTCDKSNSTSYFDEDFSNIFNTFGVRNKPSGHSRQVNYSNRYNSMPALMQFL